MDHGIFHRRFCARACLLDPAGRLKVSDYWVKEDCGDGCLFDRAGPFGRSALIHDDVWR